MLSPIKLLYLSMYNELKNTDNLKHCKMNVLCVAVSSIFAQFSVALQKKRKAYDTSYILYMPQDSSMQNVLWYTIVHKTCADTFLSQYSK